MWDQMFLVVRAANVSNRYFSAFSVKGSNYSLSFYCLIEVLIKVLIQTIRLLYERTYTALIHFKRYIIFTFLSHRVASSTAASGSTFSGHQERGSSDLVYDASPLPEAAKNGKTREIGFLDQAGVRHPRPCIWPSPAPAWLCLALTEGR